MTKTSVISSANLPADPSIEITRLELTSQGLLSPKGPEAGVISFPFECPVELDDLFVSTEGITGDAGEIALSLTPILNTPLILDQSWVRSY